MLLRKTANICLTAAALTFAFTANAGDVVADGIATDGISGKLTDGSGDNAVNADDTIDIINTVDTANAVNTINAIDTVNTIDTLNAVNKVNAIDTPNTVNTHNTINPGPRPLLGAYWGFGIGLSVGIVPIFPMWQGHFPDTLQLIGLSPAFAADTGDADTKPLRYRIIQSPDAFNFALPLYLSLYGIGEKHSFSFSVSFFRNSKEFQSTLDIVDTAATRRIGILESLVYYSASIEAAADLAIPPIFFSVDGSQQTFLSIALGASPLNAFTRECEIQTDFKDGDKRMRAVADSVGRAFAALSGNGLSVSWRIGISVLKRYQSGYGAEFGLFYSGAYSGYFYSDGVRLSEDHLKTRGVNVNAESLTSGKPLSFLSSQAEFKATLLIPAKKKADSD